MQDYCTVCLSIQRPYYISFQSAYIVYKVGWHLSKIRSNFGMVSPFFSNTAFAPKRPWCIPNSCYMAAYTAAAVPFPVESQNACRTKAWTVSWAMVTLRANLSLPGHFPQIVSPWVKQYPKEGVGHILLWKPFSLPRLQYLLPQEGHISKVNSLALLSLWLRVKRKGHSQSGYNS